MANNTYYRVSNDRVELVTEAVQELPISDEVLQRYSVDRAVKIVALFNEQLVGPGIMRPVAVSVKGKVVAFSLRLASLPIRTRFTTKDGLMVPDFASASSGSTTFQMTWTVPEGIAVYLMVCVDPSTLHTGESWLVAYDANGRCYRLPTSNVYEDCKVCQGKYDGYGTSLLDALIKAYNQFLASEWNADLANYSGEDNQSQSMFRFKLLEPDGFETVPPTGTWQSYCKRINNEFINNSIILT
jgi:hypothetical protein